MRLAMPVSSARSPPMCGWTYRLAMLLPNSRLLMSLGTLNRTRPVSTIGLMTITCPPRRRTCSSVRISRGWLLAGLPPMTNTQVGVLQIFQLDRRRAAAGDARQADAARLVAVVAAVVDVVRAVQPGEELQQEAGLVAAAAAEVPERFVGRRRAKLADDAFERFVPRDRRVAAGFARVEHRLDEPAAGFQLARRKLLQLARRIALPEVAADGALHVGDHRLQAFLADLRESGPAR